MNQTNQLCHSKTSLAYLDGYASAVEQLTQILHDPNTDMDTVRSWAKNQSRIVKQEHDELSQAQSDSQRPPSYQPTWSQETGGTRSGARYNQQSWSQEPRNNRSRARYNQQSWGQEPGDNRSGAQYNIGPDVLEDIFKHLTSRDRHALMTTCRAFLFSGMEGFVCEYGISSDPESTAVIRGSAEDFIRWVRFVFHQPQERIPLIRCVDVKSTRSLEPATLHWLRLQMVQILLLRGPKLQRFMVEGVMSLNFALKPDNTTYDVTSMEIHSGNEKDVLDDMKALFSAQIWPSLHHFKIVSIYDCLEVIESLSAFAPHLQSLHILSNLSNWTPLDAWFPHVNNLVFETLKPLNRRGLYETFPNVTSFTVRYYDSSASFNMNKRTRFTPSPNEWPNLRFLEGTVDNIYGLSMSNHVHHVRFRIQKPPGHMPANTYAQYLRGVLKTFRPHILELAYRTGEYIFSSFVSDALSEIPDGVKALSITFIPGHKHNSQSGYADRSLLRSLVVSHRRTTK
jgi:hypothetical protein